MFSRSVARWRAEGGSLTAAEGGRSALLSLRRCTPSVAADLSWLCLSGSAVCGHMTLVTAGGVDVGRRAQGGGMGGERTEQDCSSIGQP